MFGRGAAAIDLPIAGTRGMFIWEPPIFCGVWLVGIEGVFSPIVLVLELFTTPGIAMLVFRFGLFKPNEAGCPTGVVATLEFNPPVVADGPYGFLVLPPIIFKNY